MITFVQTNQATNVNGLNYAYPANPNGTPFQIPCQDTQIIASYWRIPVTAGNRVVDYDYIVATETSTPPTPDAIKILRVKLTNTAGVTQLDFAIVNTDNIAASSPPNQFAYLCDGLGGTLPVMPIVAIPIPIQESSPASTDASGNNTFIFAFPVNPDGREYNIQGEWYNGSVPGTPYAPSGITTVAAVRTWFAANRSSYGTWSNPSTNILKLVSAPGSGTYVTKAGIVVSLAPVNYCFDLTSFSAGTPVNQIQFGTGGIISLTPFTLTNDPNVLINAIKSKMSAQTTFSTSVAHKLGISTVQETPKLLNSGTTVATASSGTC